MKRIIILFILTCFPVVSYAQYNVVNDHKLKYDSKGKFKIVQFTDVHYLPGNPDLQPVLDLIKETVDAEKPDIVVFTGDVVTSDMQEKAYDELLESIIGNDIPWAVAFGNHDDEHGVARTEIMDMLQKKPYCMGSHGPCDVAGVGNYALEILDANNDSVRTVLYLMDSRSYTGIPGVGDYAWFDLSQVNWYASTSRAYRERNNGKPVPSLSFFHIPLFEYELMAADENSYIGIKQEPECNGKLNTGMFGAMKESGGMMGVFTGHDHDNDYIGDYLGIALAYGRFSGGSNTYNNIGHGCRVIELEQGRPGFTTYVRIKNGEKLHRVKYPEVFASEIKGK